MARKKKQSFSWSMIVSILVLVSWFVAFCGLVGAGVIAGYDVYHSIYSIRDLVLSLVLAVVPVNLYKLLSDFA